MRNRAVANARTARHRVKLKDIVIESKSVPCAMCGKSFPPCAMDFHHSGEDKDLNVSRMVSKAYGIVRIKEEISKCIVLCACCHRILHYSTEEETE